MSDDQNRVAELWLKAFFADTDEDEDSPAVVDVEAVAAAFAFLDEGFSERIERQAVKSQTQIAALTRQCARQRLARRRDHAAHAKATAVQSDRIAALEASLADAAKAIAELRFELARDRSWHRMIEERKFAPIVEVVAFEAAKRRTQRAIEGRN
jgi:predicted RNase H-like nuclease (RuvC/YqgF family)